MRTSLTFLVVFLATYSSLEYGILDEVLRTHHSPNDNAPELQLRKGEYVCGDQICSLPPGTPSVCEDCQVKVKDPWSKDVFKKLFRKGQRQIEKERGERPIIKRRGGIYKEE